jgi:sigma-E factor negative regulatory protein RseA
MSIAAEGDPSALENLSTLVDGELDAAAVESACAAWRDEAGVRSRWHAYQLIGDVLRSEDLASRPAHDAQFLSELRARLAAEPTVLAPAAPLRETNRSSMQPAAVGTGRHHRWAAPAAVAAGFVLVAGALLVARGPLESSSQRDAKLAAKTGADRTLAVKSPAWSPNDIQMVQRSVGGNGKLIRDVRLDRYLAAHQQFAGSSALGVPSGFVRNAAAEAPSR